MFSKAALSLALAAAGFFANMVAGYTPEMHLYVQAGTVESNRFGHVVIMTDDGNEWYATDRPDLHSGDRILITLHDNGSTDDVSDDYIVSIDVTKE